MSSWKEDNQSVLFAQEHCWLVSKIISGHKQVKTNQTSKRIFEGHVDKKFDANKEFLENHTSQSVALLQWISIKLGWSPVIKGTLSTFP